MINILTFHELSLMRWLGRFSDVQRLLRRAVEGWRKHKVVTAMGLTNPAHTSHPQAGLCLWRSPVARGSVERPAGCQLSTDSTTTLNPKP